MIPNLGRSTQRRTVSDNLTLQNMIINSEYLHVLILGCGWVFTRTETSLSLSYKVNVISLPMTNYVNFLFTLSRYGEEDFNWAKIDESPRILYQHNTG